MSNWNAPSQKSAGEDRNWNPSIKKISKMWTLFPADLSYISVCLGPSHKSRVLVKIKLFFSPLYSPGSFWNRFDPVVVPVCICTWNKRSRPAFTSALLWSDRHMEASIRAEGFVSHHQLQYLTWALAKFKKALFWVCASPVNSLVEPNNDYH